MFYLALLLVLTVMHKSYESYLSDKTVPEDVYLNYATDCVSKVALKNFVSTDELLTILVGTNSKNYDLQNMLLRELQTFFSTTTSNGTETYFTPFKIRDHKGVHKTYFQPFMKTKYYLLLVESLESYSKLINTIRHLRTYNSRAYYVVYFNKLAENRRNVALAILSKLWKMKCWQSVVVIPFKEYEFKIYGFAMRESIKKCNHMPNITVKAMYTDGQLISKVNLFRNAIKRNRRGCIIDFLIMKYPPFVLNQNDGIEIGMLRATSTYFNFTIKMQIEEVSTDWGERYPNKTWSGKLRHVQEEEVFGIGNVQATAVMYEDFDVTTGYISEKNVWVVPKARRMESWKSIYIMFPLKIWLANACIILVGGILYCALSKIGTAKRLGFTRSIFFALQMFMGNVVPNQPKHIATRMIFLMLSIYSIINQSIYESFLIDSLTNPSYERQISTENDILDSKMEIGGVSSFREVFNVPYDERAKRIYQRYVIVDDEFDNFNYWLRLVSNYRNACIVAGQIYVRYLLSRNDPLVMEQGRQKVHILRDPIISYRCRIVLPKGHYLLDTLDDIINKFRDHGFVNFWENYYSKKIEYLKTAQRSEVQVPQDVQLKLVHFQGAFGLLLFGYVCGFLALLCEIMWNRIRQKLIKRLKHLSK